IINVSSICYRLSLLLSCDSQGMSTTPTKKIVINRKSRHGGKSAPSHPSGNSTSGDTQSKPHASAGLSPNRPVQSNVSRSQHQGKHKPGQFKKKDGQSQKAKYNVPPISSPGSATLASASLK